MFASLQHILQLMQSSVQTGKATLSQVQSGSTLHSTSNLAQMISHLEMEAQEVIKALIMTIPN
jgi:hypothetical protein